MLRALSSLWQGRDLYNSVGSGRRLLKGECLICAGPSDFRIGLCSACHRDLPRRKSLRLARKIVGLSEAFAPFEYAFPVTNLVRLAKFVNDGSKLSKKNAKPNAASRQRKASHTVSATSVEASINGRKKSDDESVIGFTYG